MKLTKKAYEEYVNSLIPKVGTKMGRNDPIAFGVCYSHWVRRNERRSTHERK